MRQRLTAGPRGAVVEENLLGMILGRNHTTMGNSFQRRPRFGDGVRKGLDKVNPLFKNH